MTGVATLPGPRPQPLGALPWPAGMLIIPDVLGAAEAAAELVSGAIPPIWPDDLEFFRLALDGSPERAAALITGTDEISRYNRAVLAGGTGAWEGLIPAPDTEFGVLIAAARFSVGLDDAPPAIAGNIGGEVSAVARSARAAAALEAADLPAALAELSAAQADAAGAGSPVLAATLAATRAEILREQAGDPAAALQIADAALISPAGEPDPMAPDPQAPTPAAPFRPAPVSLPDPVRADLYLTRALARQELAAGDATQMPAVVADLTEALKIFREDTHPELFALGNQHLGLAYLTMPMSSQGERLRLGVAVTCLRAALRVYQPETHPVAWASAQLNLANALQYLPSARQRDHLTEAIDIYEQLLSYRDPATDPAGVARVLANQGNALAHLGALADAAERLTRARELFEQAGDADAAATTTDLLAGLENATAAPTAP